MARGQPKASAKPARPSDARARVATVGGTAATGSCAGAPWDHERSAAAWVSWFEAMVISSTTLVTLSSPRTSRRSSPKRLSSGALGSSQRPARVRRCRCRDIRGLPCSAQSGVGRATTVVPVLSERRFSILFLTRSARPRFARSRCIARTPSRSRDDARPEAFVREAAFALFRCSKRALGVSSEVRKTHGMREA